MKKIISSYYRNGIIGGLNVFLGKLGFKYRFLNQIDKRLIYLEDLVLAETLSTVVSGPFSGMKLSKNSKWSRKVRDIPSKLLGMYEQEVQNKLVNLQKMNKKKYLINLGGGDGFYAIGVTKNNLFEKVIVYESDSLSRDIIDQNARLNKVENKLTIKEKAEESFLKEDFFKNINLKDCIFLIDIEGDEFKLLNSTNFSKLSDTIMIVEFHDSIDKSGNENSEFLNKLKTFFAVEILTTGSRDLSKFDFL